MNWGFQGSGLGCRSCGCTPCNCFPVNCSGICTAIFVQNSWNVPAVGQNATLTVRGLKNIMVGGYLWNPTYGYFFIISFDPITGSVIVTNQGTSGNVPPGTIIPANTLFAVTDTPISNIIDFSSAITFSAGGSMTFAVTSLAKASYSRIGPKLIWFEVDVVGTTAGTASGTILHTLPVAAGALSTGAGIDAVIQQTNFLSGVSMLSDVTHNQISKYDASNFALAAGTRLRTGGLYEAA